MVQPVKGKRGFASMDSEKRREIARLGGKSVPAEKRSFSTNSDLAAQAGRKGGLAVDPTKRAFFKDHALAVEAGARGGHATQSSRFKARNHVIRPARSGAASMLVWADTRE
jgi:general stress protein YciG